MDTLGRMLAGQVCATPRGALVLVFALVALAGCGRRDATEPATPRPEPAATQESRHRLTIPRFTDVLPASGIAFRHHFLNSETGANYRISPYDHGSGLCVGDFDNDGRDDLLFLDFLGENKLYLNRGGWAFDDATARSGLGPLRAVCVGAAAGDYDRDGDLDLYLTTYRGGNRLFRNAGDATFADVTEQAGVRYMGHSSTATWFDYDLDGDLDLYLVNIGKFTREAISREAGFAYEGVELPFAAIAAGPERENPGEPNRLWRNEGDGTFTEVSRQAGLTAGEWNGDATVADFDLDGDPDLYVSNMFGANHLYRNQGDGTFQECTATALGRTSWGGMGCKFFDGNGDAYPDLLVVDMHSDMWIKPDQPAEVVADARYPTPLGPRDDVIMRSADTARSSRLVFGNTYFENNGDGTFTERSSAAGLETWWPWGVAVGDFNNDGSTDVFIPSGMGFPYFYWPNALRLNDGHGRFYEEARRAGIEPPRLGPTIPGAAIASYVKGNQRLAAPPFARSSRAAAVADLDLDGDLDLVVNNFNHEPYLLRNDSAPAHYLAIRLREKRSGSPWYGARVRVETASGAFTQQLEPGGGYLTQSSSVLHFGLGKIGEVARVVVDWPGQKEPQVVENPEVDRVLEIRQR